MVNLRSTYLTVEFLSKDSSKRVKIEATEKSEDPEDGDHIEADGLSKRSAEEIATLQKGLPRIEIKTLETAEGGGCSHVVAVPENAYYIPLHPIEKPVKTWPFKLDTFQERAITCVENYQSVLVSAHTSAGKTVVAE